MNDSVEGQDAPVDHEVVARSLSRDQLLELVLGELPDNQRMNDRMELFVLGADAKQIAGVIRKRLTALLNSSGFVPAGAAYRAVQPFRDLLEQVRIHLQPVDPKAALSILERLIQNDGKLFDRIDDSNATVGDFLREVCVAWLDCARAAGVNESEIARRMLELYFTDEYGAREALIRHAHLAISEPVLRAMAADCELRFREGPASSDSGQTAGRHQQWQIAMSLIAESLRDPKLSERAALLDSPDPNELQRLHIAQNYVRFADPAGALRWLDGPWPSRFESDRLSCLDDAYSALGRVAEVRQLREQAFEARPSVFTFERWLAVLDADAAQSAHDAARLRAQSKTDPVTAAELLIRLSDVTGAETLIVAAAPELQGGLYMALSALAETFAHTGATLGAVACYRALLEDILDRAYSPAYSHAAQYWKRLQELAPRIADYQSLETRADYDVRIRARHGRKPAFWRKVEELN